MALFTVPPHRYKRYGQSRRLQTDDPTEIVKLNLDDVMEFLRQHPDQLEAVQEAEAQGKDRTTIAELTPEDLA